MIRIDDWYIVYNIVLVGLYNTFDFLARSAVAHCDQPRLWDKKSMVGAGLLSKAGLIFVQGQESSKDSGQKVSQGSSVRVAHCH